MQAQFNAATSAARNGFAGLGWFRRVVSQGGFAGLGWFRRVRRRCSRLVGGALPDDLALADTRGRREQRGRHRWTRSVRSRLGGGRRHRRWLLRLCRHRLLGCTLCGLQGYTWFQLGFRGRRRRGRGGARCAQEGAEAAPAPLARLQGRPSSALKRRKNASVGHRWSHRRRRHCRRHPCRRHRCRR